MRHVSVTPLFAVAALSLLGAVAGGPNGRVAADDAPVRPDCIEHADSVELASVADAESRLVGTWIRCAQATRKFIAHEGDDIGFEFTADGRFYRIYPDEQGGLIRAEGLYQEGTWRIDDTSDSGSAGFGQTASLQLHPLGSGYFSDVITFHDDPLAIGVPHAKFHYFRWTGDEPTPAAPPGIGVGRCGHPVDPVTIESSSDVESLLVGAWTLCEPDAGTFAFGAGALGVEFGADGQFWRLVRAADGSVVRDQGQSEMTWTVDPFAAGTLTWGNEPQLGIATDGSTQYFNPLFFAGPPFVSFGWSGAGLLRGMPSASEAPAQVPLPGTGADQAQLTASIAGTLVLAGAAAWVLARRARSATTARQR
jgi:LPXTG-motif cell wall-anchored protein